MSAIFYSVLIVLIGVVLYRAGYADGYDEGRIDAENEDDETEIYMEHNHGGDRG